MIRYNEFLIDLRSNFGNLETNLVIMILGIYKIYYMAGFV